MQAIYTNITPELASRWLENNTFNRSKKSNRIKAYAHDMENGKWRVQGSTIQLGTSGRLLDGQNRLFACILSNTSFPSWVIYNVPEESFMVIDSGATRSGADALHVLGEKYATNLSATLNIIGAYERGATYGILSGGSGSVSLSFGSQDRISLLERYPIIRESVHKVNSFNSNRNVLAALYTLGHLAGKGEYMDEFLEKLKAGAGLPPGSPILLLRDRLFGTDRVATRLSTAGHKLAISIKAFNAYLEGNNERRQLAFRDNETYPKVIGDKLFGSYKESV